MNQMKNLKDKHQSLGKSNIGKLFYAPILIVAISLILLWLKIFDSHIVIILSFVAVFIFIPLLFVAIIKAVKYSNHKMDITIKSLFQSIQNDINMEKDTDYVFSSKEEVKKDRINQADLFTHRASEINLLSLGNEHIKLYTTAFMIRNGQYSSYAFHGFYIIYNTQNINSFEIRDKGKSKNYPLLKELDTFKIYANQGTDIHQELINWYKMIKNNPKNKSVLIGTKQQELHIAIHRFPFAPPRVRKYQEKDYEKIKNYIMDMNDILHTLESHTEL